MMMMMMMNVDSRLYNNGEELTIKQSIVQRSVNLISKGGVVAPTAPLSIILPIGYRFSLLD